MASSTLEAVTTAVITTTATLAAAPEATTESAHHDETRPSAAATKLIAVVLPALFALVLLILVVIAFLIPRFARGADTPILREERRRRRMARLNKDVKAQAYKEWSSTLKGEHSSTYLSQPPLCVICLDGIDDAANIRGLGCLHVFHQECLDDWFARFNNYCPLCHRPILQATAKEEELDALERRRRTVPPLLMV